MKKVMVIVSIYTTRAKLRQAGRSAVLNLYERVEPQK